MEFYQLFKRLPGIILFLFISFQGHSQSGTSGFLCGYCGHVERSRAAMLQHTCAYHHVNCVSTPVYTAPVYTKSPEEIRREREQKDAREAAQDSNDSGAYYFERRDWVNAIRLFKESLDFDGGFDDAKINLQKAEANWREQQDKIALEEEMRKKEEDEKIKPVIIPDRIQQYMNEADKIIVPPPSWESALAEKVDQIRLGQKEEEKNLSIGINTFLAAFDQATTLGETETYQFKFLVIGAKSTISAQNEAEIIVFKQNAWYERALQVLKDKNQSPKLIAIIKALKDKKPIPSDTDPDLIKLAKALQDPALGNSSVHTAMNAMLSPEAKASFFQTAKAETMELVNDKIKDLAGDAIRNRFRALREINEKINLGEEMKAKESDPLNKSIIQNKISELEKMIEPFKKIPEAISSVVAFYDSLNEK